MRLFPFYKQRDRMDCGPTCLRMIAKYYGKSFSMNQLREKAFLNKEGTSLLNISDAAESMGFRTIGVELSIEQLIKEAKLPCIVHWNGRHFVVVYKVSKGKIKVADPAIGILTYSIDEFLKYWTSMKSNGHKRGIVLLIEPTPLFYQNSDEIDLNQKIGFRYILSYLFVYKGLIKQLIVVMLLANGIQLVFPFLTQSIVDVGISNRDLPFIYMILAGQIMLFIGRTFTEFFRRWVMLHLSTRISLSIISDFLIKIMKLPMKFFDSKRVGDLLQRIDDHTRIENFISSFTIGMIFSILNFIIYSIVLASYDLTIFYVFIGLSVIYVGYVMIFLKIRRALDYKRFSILSQNRSNLVHLIYGMQEIKLHNCERSKRWEWQRIQAKQFHVGIDSIRLQQVQEGGSLAINELKNILITIISATAVVNGSITLGMMMAIQYIIGQLNAPINEFASLTGRIQDARISLDRMGEIHSMDEEKSPLQSENDLDKRGDLILDKISFRYEGRNSGKALDDISLTIQRGSVTAIVGNSGSGKSTLQKILLKFYTPTSGRILLGDTSFESISPNKWREECGVVLQGGYIFSDSVMRNICLNENDHDFERVKYAAKLANIDSFIETLPSKYYTVIGDEGLGLSAGQKQRILIARAIYKNPEFLFFDEATSSLDSNNERIIMDNLFDFFKGKTVIIIAHRLSTVRNADQIVVLDNGKIVEVGNHFELAKKNGEYYNLVKNQLELGEPLVQ